MSQKHSKHSNKHKKYVYVMGNVWKILWVEDTEYPEIKGCVGLTDFSTRTIHINITAIKDVQRDNKVVYEKEVIRHELVHAMLYECGLDSSWAENEEVTDWIAIQFNKIMGVFKAVDAI